MDIFSDTTTFSGAILMNLRSFADDAAAGIGGVVTGQLYQTDGTDISFPFVGVVKIKQ